MKKNYFKENWISLVIPTWWILLWMCTKIFILMKFHMVSCSVNKEVFLYILFLASKIIAGNTVNMVLKLQYCFPLTLRKE